jgi:Sulfotransferase family
VQNLEGDSTAHTGASPIRVLMIVGQARSGSTFLDIALGNHPDIESVGELVNVAGLGWINNEYCACGVRARACPYWNNVRQLVDARVGGFEPERYVSLQQEFEGARRIPSLLANRRVPSDRFRAYAAETRTLYESILTVGGKRLIVDSSKSPARALAVSMIPGIDVRVLHLVRDARGVAWSLKKSYRRNDAGGVQHDMPGEPVWRTALLWSKANLMCSVVGHRFAKDHRGFVRYEDTVRQPRTAFQAVGKLLSVDLSSLGDRVAIGEAMMPGHNIAGNRLRMQREVRLRPDNEWRSRLTRVDRAEIWALAGPLMLWYGYGG